MIAFKNYSGKIALKARSSNACKFLERSDGLRVGSGQFEERLKDYQPGDTIELTTFHGDELKLRSLTLAQPRATNYSIDVIENPSTIQQQNFEQWLGLPLASVFR